MLVKLRKICSDKGFDICDPIHTNWYNDVIEKEGLVSRGVLKKMSEPHTILDKESKGTRYQYNAVLIGNSKTIWRKFISWLSSRYKQKLEENREFSESEKEESLNQLLNADPLDTFVGERLPEVFRSIFSDRSSCEIASQIESIEFYWSHGGHEKVILSSNYCVSKQASMLVSMQRVAQVTGKYWHDNEGSKLCVHPLFGTWKAFRAVVVFHKVQNDNDPLSVPKPLPLCPCPVTPKEIEDAKEAMQQALEMSPGSDKNNGYGVFTDNQKDDELCNFLHNSKCCGKTLSLVSPTMRQWIHVRDCITIGRDTYKYCDNQLLYHYTKDIDLLKKELQSFQ
jgi:hypothetical protein